MSTPKMSADCSALLGAGLKRGSGESLFQFSAVSPKNTDVSYP